jgi:glycosyltransferase involved in cell wall biosynthesis
MSTLVALFPSELETLTRTRRLESLRESYLFAGFDRTLCVLVNAEHGERREHRVDDDFRYLELGLKRWPRAGRTGMLLSLAPLVASLTSEARCFGAEAVLAYDPHLLGLVGLAAARLLRVPLGIRLIQHYGLKFEHTGRLAFAPFRRRGVEVAVERSLFRAADAVLVACPSHADYVRAIAGDRVALAPYLTAQSALFYPPPPSDDRIRQELAPGAKRVIVSVGRFMPEKYSVDLPVFARELDDPETALVLIGDGPLRGEMERAAAGSRTRVIFAGYQPQERIRALFAAADLAVVLQGGGAITEAALSGAAILTYDYEMNPFVVRPGHDEGALVPFRDTAQLARAARELMGDQERNRRFREHARAAALARFNEAAACAAERAIATRLLARDRSAADFGIWQLDHRVEGNENRHRHTAA